MPPPTGKEGVRRFIGFVTYLSKFIPNLSEVDAPLRQLVKSDVEFVWQPAHQQAFDKLKQLCTHPLLLKFYDPARPVKIFCDASSMGLGAMLLQDDLPVAFSSRSLTDVIIYNDHKPLEDIYKKKLLSTPMRTQRMHL